MKIAKWSAVAIVMGLLSACSSPMHLSKSSTPLNILTGLPGSNGPVLAVKIDDTLAAHPQIGLEQADVVYIEQVEGGLTRLAAIYSQYPKRIPAAIGPIRSARISDIDLLAQYGRVAFAFSGAQSKFYPVLNAANIENISADREPASIYSRDPARTAPTDMLLDPAKLLDKTINVESRRIETVKSVGWKFGALSLDAKNLKALGAIKIETASLQWPASSYQLNWDSAGKKWLIDYRHAADMGANGSQLFSQNFVIQEVSITDSIYHDKVGGITPFSNTVGTGSGYLLRDGYAIPISWNRPAPESATTWNFLDGSEAKFTPSQIWVALTDKQPSFTYPTLAK
jgi:hypothetical protein